MFFAGVKKLPPAAEREKKKTYSPYGEYFPAIMGALSYASDKWGIKIPINQAPYTKEQLAPVNIPEHIKA
jgi:hypothetical protein